MFYNQADVDSYFTALSITPAPLTLSRSMPSSLGLGYGYAYTTGLWLAYGGLCTN